MKQRSAVLTFLVIAVFVVTSTAHSQSNRTWVSNAGDDTNPCSRAAPCKTFAGTISKTAAGGEISILDSGSFGTINVTKAVTIKGDGTLAGVIINAGPNDRVVLRNLSISGAGTGINGISFLAGKRLIVNNVTINGFTTRGIDVSLAASGNLSVKDSTITNVPTGIFVTTTSGQAQALIDHVHLEGLSNGLEASTNGRATISNSVISENTSNGILASGANTEINVYSCQLSFNELAGINASVSGARIRMSDNDIYNNSASLSIAAGGIVFSAGNNRVAGNTSEPAPNGGAIPIQ